MSGYIGSKASVTQVDGYNQADADAEFVNDPNGAITVDGSNNVGIGTSSPLTGLYSTVSHISGTSGGLILSSSTSTFGIGSVAGVLQFYDSTNAAERMRIDSSGNLLVGTTEAYPGAGVAENRAGVSVEDTYGIHASADGERSLLLNRMNSDGTIVDFRKDGSTVGSIGTELGRLHIGSDDSMILFDAGGTNAIWPWASTATSDGDADDTIDIGDSSNRFKDAHFSGTVNAGSFAGDGSALTGVGGSTTAGAVGTYAYLITTSANVGITPGSTRSGSSLRYSAQSSNSISSASGYSVGHTHSSAPAGTWQAMGGRNTTGTYTYAATLYVRIS